ncbi:annulin-like [Anopheles bellator]|uniref:annulin-like n=1 Tax=Anopheles bellator TaxID=139047 RepID=UPI0026477A61|nr:annulin-like [Anopheles bellator]
MWPARRVNGNASESRILTIEAIDLCFDENGKAHHTDHYEMMSDPRVEQLRRRELVVRRGDRFTVRLLCNRPFNDQADTVVVTAYVKPFGSEKVSFGNGCMVHMALETQQPQTTDATEPQDWSATIVGSWKDGAKETISVAIFVPAGASVSRWNLAFNCRLDATNGKSSFEIPDPFYVLFNPWCKSDLVYLEDESARQEYVLNDSTMIWKSTPKDRGMHSWNVGQFEVDVLSCAMFIVGVTGRVAPTYRGNPVRVVRALSGALSTANGLGVLRGRWTGDYGGGTPPHGWSGSVKILQQFYNTDEAVEYGQCWVFAGVFLTVCRALGIPCRAVTAFECAHDTESSLTIDIFVDDSNSTVSEYSEDSVWNFHVWNEVWMRRPDLAVPRYDGWQVVDATPQEMSDGMFKLGPAPVASIKEGAINTLYDTDFVYSEVNADKIYWSVDGSGNMNPTPLLTDTGSIGQHLSTKAIGFNRREDVTDSYKFPEGSQKEREVMRSVVVQGCQRFSGTCVASKQLSPATKAADHGHGIQLAMRACSEHVLGKPFGVELIVSNSSNAVHDVEGSINLKHSDYTGKHTELIRTVPFSVTVAAGQQVSIKESLNYNEYRSTKFDQTHIKAFCMAGLKGDTSKKLFVNSDFSLEIPSIEMKLETKSDGSMTVVAQLQNPLSIPLTDGRFIFEGSRFTKPLEIRFPKIQENELIKAAYPIAKRGKKCSTIVSARFCANELKHVSGYHAFDLQ